MLRFIIVLLSIASTAATIISISSFSTGNTTSRAKLDSGVTINVTQPFPYIIGGEVAGNNEFPWFGRTEIRIGNNIYSCGGSLIHSDIVMSAAHCIVDDIRDNPGTAFSVTFNLGANQYSGSDGTILSVSDIYWPTDYGDDENDIVFYKLTGSASVQPVSWNSDSSIPSVGSIGTAIGFGRTSNDGEESAILLKADLATISNAQCERTYGNLYEGNVCTFTQGKSTCIGDSGGPIVTQNGVVFGLTSFGLQVGCDQGPTVFTRVSWFSDLIESVSKLQ
jgi:trypsin